MITTALFFACLGAILYLIGFVPYIYHAFRGKVVPHPFTWTVGFMLSAINTYGLFLSDGFTDTLIPTVVRTWALFIGLFVGWYFIARISLNWFDYFCIILWVGCLFIASYIWVSEAIIPTIIVDILVLSPTLKKIWRDPDSEDIFAWVLTVFSQACLLLSLGHYTLENSLFWAYVMSVNALVAILIYRRRLFVSTWTYKIKKLLSTFSL